MSYAISKKKIKKNILIFFIAQLAMWYGGLADLIPNFLISRWNLFQLASIAILLLFFIKRRKMPNCFTLVFIISRLTLLASTVLNYNIPDMTTIYRMIALVFLVDLFSDSIEDLASPIMFIFEVMVYYNLITILVGQADVYGAYYGALGYDNDFTRYLLSAYIWSIFYSFTKKKYFRTFILVVAIHITLFYIWSGTGIVSVLMMDLLIFLGIAKSKKISILQGYFVYIITIVIVVILRLQNMLAFLIVDILHKDLSFTGRTDIWDKAIQYIIRKPLQGYGMMGQTLETLYLGGAHCHNAILEQLFRGGIIYAGLFFVLIVLLHKSTNKFLDNKLVSSLCMAVCGIWIVCVTESILDDYIVWLIFALIYNLQHSLYIDDK